MTVDGGTGEDRDATKLKVTSQKPEVRTAIGLKAARERRV
jgi:hypothetical protein